MSKQERIAYLGVFGGVAVSMAVLALVGVRVRRAADADSLALRASHVIDQCGDLLAGPDFLWAVWHDTARAAGMGLLIRNGRDEVVGTVTKPAVVLDGVLKRLEHAGRHYEIRKPGLMSSHTCLHEAGREAVLFRAKRAMRGTTLYHADGVTPLCVLPTGSVPRRVRPVRAAGLDIGRIIAGLEQDAHARILVVPDGRLPLLAQVYLLASL